ncbi:MAG: phage portal protein [Dehalococcoidia bacterium]
MTDPSLRSRTSFNPASLNRMDTQRLAAYRSNLDFYNGSHWPTTSRHRQLVFNYAKVSIDKVTSFLIQGLNFACYPGEGTDELKARAHSAEQLLRQVYEDNNLQQLDYETEIDAAILGDGCYKVIWDTDEKRIRITTPDVSGIYAWWLGDDTSRVWRVASRYTLTQDEISILYGQSIEKKQAIITELWTAKTFDLFLDNDLMESKPNPYDFIPFVIFPNLREPKKFWGSSDIPSLIQPQRELNRALSQLSRILELSGNPIAVLENIASAEDIKVQPGALWTIPEDAKAYLLDLLQGGGVRLHVDYIDLLYRALHDISETPRAAWGGIEKELSGTALQIELGSLTQKVTRKRTIRTNAYHQRNDIILKLAERYMNENFDQINHRVVWGPILPQDAARQAQNEQLLVQAGVHSRRTAMDELGIQDPDEEFNRWLEERGRILKMNQEFRAASTRGGARERAVAAEMEVPE